MTQHARAGYGRHRKATWGLALLLALAIAAIAIPLASGAADKTYTLSLNPSAQCASSTDGGASTVVTLKNTARTASLGSAEIFFPANSIFSVTRGTSTVPFQPNVSGSPYYSGNWDIIGPLNSLGLSPGQSLNITVTFRAGVQAGAVQAVVKQANNFMDNVGTANLFANPSTWPQLSVAQCQYYFSQQPVDTQTGTAQTVKVQLRSGTTPVSVSGGLTLNAYQTANQTTTQVDGNFAGLTSSGQDLTNTWSFSVTGNVDGTGYFLRAGNGTDQQRDSNSFAIYDCLPSGGTCTSSTSFDDNGSTGGQITGSGLGTGVNLSFVSSLPTTGAAICSSLWGWQDLTFPAQPDESTTFDGIALSDYTVTSNGFVKATMYLRNDLFVQTSASQTNDIEICAGVKHTNPNAPQGAFMGRNGILAQFDQDTQQYWGVLARVPNCNKTPDVDKTGPLDPVLCAWGTATLNGIDYRSATVLIPYDWDYTGKVG
jgi:hypothetical protein